MHREASGERSRELRTQGRTFRFASGMCAPPFYVHKTMRWEMRMSEMMSRRDAVANAVEWAARAQTQADILLRAERGDAAVYEQQFGAGGRCGTAVTMANMWANVAAVLDVEPAPEPAVIANEEDREPGQWFRDRDDDLWQLHADGLYHLRGVGRGSLLDDVERNFGPIIPKDSAAASEEKLRAAKWLRDRDGDFWEMRKDWYYLNGWGACSLGRSFEEIQHGYGPLTIAEDPSS